MSILVLGLSHRSAPLALLERAVLDAETADKLAADLVEGESVSEALVLSTCNRVEVYAEVDRFHPAVADTVELLARHSGADPQDLGDTAYVFHDERAAQHLFSVACGLESMALGESQILGQLRAALRRAQAGGTLGPMLSAAGDAALRLGKKAHTDTALDTAAPSLLDAGLDLAATALGTLSGRRALLVGAGSMGTLAVAALRRRGVEDLGVASRQLASAQRLAGPGARAVSLEDLGTALRDSDLVISCTGAPEPVLTRELVAGALLRRPGRPQVYLDLALPRDIEPGIAAFPEVTLIDLEILGAAYRHPETARVLDLRDGAEHPAPTSPDEVAADLLAVRALVSEEVLAYTGWRRGRGVVPTVSALRAWAGQVADAELGRLAGRTPEMADPTRTEVELMVRRVVDKLLHPPTVRMRELAAEGSEPYAEVVRTLFDLDVRSLGQLSRAEGALPPMVATLADLPTEVDR